MHLNKPAIISIVGFFKVLLLSFSPNLQAQTVVSTELSLVVDSSASISLQEFKDQLEGYVNAFNSPEIRDALIGPDAVGKVAVNVIVYTSEPFEEIDFTVLDSPSALSSFISELEVLRDGEKKSGGTDMGKALAFAIDSQNTNQFSGFRRVIDMSGDGMTDNVNFLGSQRSTALSNGFVINGLAVGDADVVKFFEEDVIGGPGSFVESVSGFNGNFAAAVTRKIAREISASRIPLPKPFEVEYLNEKVNINLTLNGGPNFALEWSEDHLTWQVLRNWAFPVQVENREESVIDQTPLAGRRFYRLVINGVIPSSTCVADKKEIHGRGIDDQRFSILGITGHNPISFRGAVTGLNGHILLDSNASNDSLLDESRTYLLEVISGDLCGVVQEIISFENTSLVLQDDLSSDLQIGDAYNIREAPTLNSIFGVKGSFDGFTNKFGLAESTNSSMNTDGDQVFIPNPDNPGGFDKYTYQEVRGFFVDGGWVRVGQDMYPNGRFGDENIGLTPLIYTDAITINRIMPTPLEIVVTGEVINHKVSYAITQQFNYLGVPFAIPVTIEASGAVDTITSTSSQGSSDILNFAPDGWSLTHQEYEKYWYFAGGFFGGDAGWRYNLGNGPSAPVDPGEVEVADAIIFKNSGQSQNFVLRPSN